MNRRKFISTATIATSALALSACDKPTTSTTSPSTSTKKFNWRLQLVVSKNLPIWSEGVIEFARKVKLISNDRLNIKVYGAGELFPAFELFDKVKDATIEMGHSASYFWSGKIPGCEFFTGLPFGLNADGMNSWIYNGGGLKLWEELYAPHNLVPIPCGSTGVQMGGWFNKEIKTIEDYKGLKMRMPGLGGKVINKAGASAETIPQSEIYTSLATGRIDATEWVGPYHDYTMDFYKAAKFYYIGGWHEPGSMLELIINKDAYASLPEDLKEILKVCAAETNKQMLNEWILKDAEYYQKMLQEGIVQFREFPLEVVKQMKIYAKEVIAELAAKNDMTKKIHESFSKFQALYEPYQEISERAFVKALKS